MACLSELEGSMHADGALAPEEAARAEQHLATCAACRALVAALAEERRALAAALEGEAAPVRVPAFSGARGRARSGGGGLAAAALLGLLCLGPLVLAGVLADLGVPRVLAWLDPVASAVLVEAGVDAAFSVIDGGGEFMTSIIETIGSGVVLALLAWGAYTVLSRRGGAAVLASLVLGALVLPSAQALEVRRSEDRVTVAADETIDDTLIAFGRRVEVDGTVTGDLIAFGRRVDVRGTVEGQLITFAQNVNVDGDVRSGMIGFAQFLELGQAEIARNFIGFGQNVTTYADARVLENAVLFGRNVELAGPVERDVLGFGKRIDVRSAIGGDLTTHSERVSLEAPARIGGNVLAHLPAEENLERSSGATIDGTVSTEIEDIRVPELRYSRSAFYFGQAVRLAAAFVAGLILLGLVPSLRRASLDDGMAALAAGGIGLVALVATPIVALVVAITIVGLPVAVLGVIAWLVALYLAKIVLAHFVGRRLSEKTGEPKHFAVALLIGLLLMIVAVNLPFVGGLVNFLLTITGLGMLVIWLSRVIQGRSPGNGGAAAIA